MKWLESKKSDLENHLAASKQNFSFDSENVKQRLMMSVKARHLTKEEKALLIYRPSLWPKYAMGMTIAVILAVTTTGLAYASNQSKPGDILFPVQKFQNQIVLSLPLPQSTKAEISTNIAVKRMKELDDLSKDPKANPAKVTAELKEADESIKKAAGFVPQNDSETTSTTKKHDDSDKLLNQLDDLTTLQQQTLTTLGVQVQDKELKTKIENSLQDIQTTKDNLKKRHRHESKDHEDNSGDSNPDPNQNPD